MSFSRDMLGGFRRPVRYGFGEGVNVWASKLNECAYKLDALADRLPPEAVAILHELFEEIGQQSRDAHGLGEQLARRT